MYLRLFYFHYLEKNPGWVTDQGWNEDYRNEY
jgi:hypothetical protein